MVDYSVQMTHTSVHCVYFTSCTTQSLLVQKQNNFAIFLQAEDMYPVPVFPQNVLQLKFTFQPRKGHITGFLRLLTY